MRTWVVGGKIIAMWKIVQIFFYVFLSVCWLATFLGFDAPTDPEVAMNWLTEIDVWIINSAAYPGLFVLFTGLVIGFIFVPAIWRNLQRFIPQQILPDVSAREAFKHLMLDSKWALGKDPDIDGFYNLINGELKDAASLGTLKVWARVRPKMRGGYPEPLTEIEPSRWDKLTFDLPSCMAAGDTAMLMDYSDSHWVYLEDAQLNKAQILANWPKANLFQKSMDKFYKDRKRFYSNESQVTHNVARSVS